MISERKAVITSKMASGNNVYGLTSKCKTVITFGAARGNIDLAKGTMAPNTGSTQKKQICNHGTLAKDMVSLGILTKIRLAFARSCMAVVSLPNLSMI